MPLEYQLDNFLGFMVHKRGIKIGQKSMKAIDEAVPSTTKTELQSLLGNINFMRRYISNLSEKVLLFSPLLKLKNDQEFRWSDIQEYMKYPPMRVPP